VNNLLFSVVELTRLTLPGMKQRRWGRILNVTSIAAKQPVENLLLSNCVPCRRNGLCEDARERGGRVLA
jgi:3-oxoacyl-[acyl-carrier protein] reductase